jgi:hypothetical protein
MSNLTDNVKHWRDRAEEARAVASDMRDEIARAQMLITLAPKIIAVICFCP